MCLIWFSFNLMWNNSNNEFIYLFIYLFIYWFYDQRNDIYMFVKGIIKENLNQATFYMSMVWVLNKFEEDTITNFIWSEFGKYRVYMDININMIMSL